MGWKVNILLLWTFLMSTSGQMVLNTINRRVTEISGTENQNPENGIENNVIPNHKNPGDENSKVVPVDPPVPEHSKEGQQSNEGQQSDEAQLSKEEISVARSSEQVISSVQVSSEVTEAIVVSTTHGPVQGHQWNESPDIISYLDIPYGRISEKFQAPDCPETWEKPHHVVEHSVHCPQVKINEETGTTEVTGSLDCLTLSVFAPKDAENADVLFYIHDGNFATSSGDPSIYGPEYLVSRGIVLVLPNYRLGPLGFLCLRNEIAPGNAALKDLTLALNWTKANIAAFGGNPDNIVVSGDGMSGALAGYLVLSPASKGYVSRIIAETGSVVSHLAIDRDPITTATALADKIRTMYSEHTFSESFFDEIDVQKLILGAQGVHLRPCVENGSDPFITETPWHMLHNQNISVSFMIGSASFAGLHEAHSYDVDSISQLNEDFGTFMPDDLLFKNGEKREMANTVKKQYFGESPISTNSAALALVHTDASYLGPAIRAARVLLEAGATVYFYEFAFVGALNRERIVLGSSVNGSARGDIVGYLFTQSGQVPEEGSKEDQMVNLMVDLWTSFMYNGMPSSNGVEWNQLESTSEEEEEWLWIGSEAQARKGIHVNRLQLWTKIYDDHFMERNIAKTAPQNPALIVIAISMLGLFPKSMRVSR